MSEELVTIEVDGCEIQARPGAMLIEATDAAGINVPRFCYHKKLSVAANCRMCLVEVVKAPKPLPACATPVAAGMKVFTKSARALSAQNGTMEFLLINHPLDCPICDQGGECELQDVAMGYGESGSRYGDTKRVVADKDIGPLIETEMTRCIHCTRCVRFGEEIAGVRELGMTGRGETARIGTYIATAVDSEMSGNVIDLCPVGALTAKPSRYTARPWELIQHASVAPHDCMGSNIFVHTRDGKVMRVVPKENESINEVWLSDRDRFSYEGLYADDRATKPLLKDGDNWHEVEWEEALAVAVKGLQNSADLAALVSPTATIEEQFLLQKLVRALGSNNIDHRLRQTDFSDQDQAPVMPWLGSAITELDNLDAALLIGSNVRKEQPIAANRIRKAALAGGKISFINGRRYPLHFDAQQLVVSPLQMAAELAAVATAVYELNGQAVPADVQQCLESQQVSSRHRTIAEQLLNSKNAIVLLGSAAVCHPHFAALRSLAAKIAAASNTVFGYLPEAGNTAGAWLAGCVPHRGVAGAQATGHGNTALEIFTKPSRAYLLYDVEPEFDCYDPGLANKALEAAEIVIACSAYASEALKKHADVILPIGAFAEINGTYVNAEGRWQTFRPAANLLGEARPGWKVLRMFATLSECTGFDYMDVAAVRAELKEHCRDVQLNNQIDTDAKTDLHTESKGVYRFGEVAAYSADSLLRRARALQATTDAKQFGAHINSSMAAKLKLNGSKRVSLKQGEVQAVLPVFVDDDISDETVWIPAGTSGAEKLGAIYGSVEVKKV